MGISAAAGGGAGNGTTLLAGDQTIWAEATGFISSVCSDLKVGELIHGENFSLFEAMSALEIMDPKMDAGMATTGFKTAEEAIGSGAAPVNLNVYQIIDVMDHLLACEATWHKGHSLAQTVFSCLYLLKLERTLPNPLLYAYCKIVQATCSLVRRAVTAAHNYEEEEIFTVAFGLPLEESDGKSLGTMTAVEETVARQLRRSKSITAKKKVLEEVEALQEDPSLEEECCKAVLCRLRFRKALHHTFLYMDKPQGRGLEMARKHLSLALAELTNIRSSSSFLSSQSNVVPGALHSQSTASGRVAIGFDEDVNRRLLAPTPPRSIKILSWEEALAYFEHLLRDLDHICCVPLNLGLEALLHFLVDFHKSHPDLVARSRLQLLLIQGGKLFGSETIPHALCEALNLQQDALAQTAESEVVFQQAGQLALSLVRLLCTNPAWRRRKLGKMLQDWSNLLQQAEVLLGLPPDGELLEAHNKSWWKDNVLVGWVAEQICWVAAQFLLGGFELELYSPNEYCMIYWYLDHILRTHLHCKITKERVLFEKEQSLKVLDATTDPAKKKGKKKKGLAKGAAKEIRLTPTIHLLQCYIDLCSGFIWMLTALTEDHKIVHRQSNLNTDQERFFQRFELLHKVLVPEPMMYYQFKDAIGHRKFSVRQVYQMSYDHFMDVSSHLQDLVQAISKDTEWSPLSREQKMVEIRQMEQVALRNRLALQIALQAGAGETLKVSFEFSQHPCFAVAVVKKSG